MLGLMANAKWRNLCASFALATRRLGPRCWLWTYSFRACLKLHMILHYNQYVAIYSRPNLSAQQQHVFISRVSSAGHYDNFNAPIIDTEARQRATRGSRETIA